MNNNYILKESVLLIFFRMMFKVSQLGFLLLVARYLSQENYGDFQFIAGIINLISQPAIVLTLIIARIGCCFSESTQLGNMKFFFNQWKNRIIILFVITIAIFGAIDKPLGRIGRIETEGAIFFAGITIAATFVFNFIIGFFQAKESFLKIGILYFITGLAILLLCAVAVVTDLGTLSIYGTEAFGRVIALLIALFLIISLMPKEETPIGAKRIPSNEYNIWLFFTMIAFFIAYNMDILLVKAIFDRTTAGGYLRMDLAGKLMFMLGSTIAIIIFPKTSKAFNAKKNTTLVLFKGTIIFLFITCIAATVLIIFQTEIFSLIYGSSFDTHSKVLIFIILNRISEAYIFILINYLAAIMSSFILYCLSGLVLIQGIMLFANHDNLLQVAMNMAGASIACTIAMLIIVISFERKYSTLLESAKG